MRRWAFAVALLMLPAAAAEFGVEKDGFPVNTAGETVAPFVPAHWVERNPALLDLMPDDPLNKLGDATVFPYYGILTAELRRLADEHPHLVRLTSAGQSHAGLDLWLLEIADFSNPNKVPLAEREVVYLDGGTHSNEYSGVYFVTEWAQFLLDEYETNETARWIVENRHTWILPMVNPDGSHAFGRVNAIDVNINRNFPSTWGTVDETPVLNWPGPYPASEPETQAVVNVLDDIQPDYVNSIHCCGNLWLHPYGAEHLGHAPDFDMFTNVCDEVFADVRDDCGETWSTIYPASGTTLDEGYGRVGAASWSYEMSGRGSVAAWGQPVIVNDPREQEIESWNGVMHAFLHVEAYGGQPVIAAMAGDKDALTVTVRNDGLGNLSRATANIAGASISLPDLMPGETTSFDVAGNFEEGQVPVELTWKKRLHPESNWGEWRSSVALESIAGRLVAALPVAVEKPAFHLGTGPSEHGALMEAEAGEDASALFVGVVLALVAAVVVRRR